MRAWKTAPSSLCGHRFEIEVRDPRRWSRHRPPARTAACSASRRRCRARWSACLYAVGDTVEAGQGIVVVEAMKMQNEMKAARAGKIASLSAKVGATVTAGEVLATIE